MHCKIWRMTRWGLVLGMAGCLTAGLLGCCGQNTKLDYGRSVRYNLANSLLNPQAGQEEVVSRGQPPEAAANAYEKYNKSFAPQKNQKTLFSFTSGDNQAGNN